MEEENDKRHGELFGINLNGLFGICVEVIGGLSVGVFLFWILATGFTSLADLFLSARSTIDLNKATEYAEPSAPLTYTRPERIRIPKIDVNSVVLQPEDPKVEILDEALKRGAVHYPGSGTLEDGNIFIFGHSTNWVVVQNQAYKTFNNLDDLLPGDLIYLEGSGEEYTYQVEDVSLVDENRAFVDLTGTGRRLTISTCNSFGKKQERWVVSAKYMGEGDIKRATQ